MVQLIQIIHKHIMQEQVYAKKGFVTLFSLIILMLISISVFSSILLVNIDSLNGIRTVRDAINARSLANSCVEIGLNKLKIDDAYQGDEVFVFNEGNCEILQVQLNSNNDHILRTIGTSGVSIKKMEVLILQLIPETQLDYYIETDF